MREKEAIVVWQGNGVGVGRLFFELLLARHVEHAPRLLVALRALFHE